MNKTSIEWVKNPDGSQGYTFNPITGCLNNCPYCYARKLANGRLRSRYLANENTIPNVYISSKFLPMPTGLEWDKVKSDPFYPRFWEDRVGQIPLFGKSLGIFVCDMSDLFGIGVPRIWTERVLNHIGECQRHRFYLLTKQPQNLIKWSPFPDNCWVGVTATNRNMWFNAVWELQDVKASVKYLSIEPLLSWDTKMPSEMHTNLMSDWFIRSGIQWVIIGAQTKPYKPPKIEAVEEIVQACDKAEIPVFIKNNLSALARNIVLYPSMKVGDSGWDNVRQEMPS